MRRAQDGAARRVATQRTINSLSDDHEALVARIIDASATRLAAQRVIGAALVERTTFRHGREHTLLTNAPLDARRS